MIALVNETPTEGTARLLVQCPDRPGIIAGVSRFLFEHGANIVQADEYASGGEEPRFFLRMEYELAGLDASPDEIAALFGTEVAPRFGMHWNISYSASRPRIAILVSNVGHCLLDLLWRWRSGELHAEIAMVISNHDRFRPDVEPLGVPYHHLPVTRETKPEQEQQLLSLLRGSVDLVVLARYMQILTPTVLDEFPQAIINIHHSFLPAFIGADPYRQARERGVKIIGATAHYATEDLDEGPIIEQDVARVSHRDTRAELIRRGREIERVVLARAVRWHIESRILVHGNQTVVFP
ncbi:MAG: formyltetrahydrofolate deformylase [Chloroflexi bacterium]|nr:formyltetrahydrofolate deformylase [Chloroflexota bacterium]